jgi:hypothetical protein
VSGRIRTIKPELLEDAVTAGLSDAAFRLFIGVILLSDDYGCFRAEPAFLSGQIWWKSVATVPIESAITELTSLIEWYVVKGQRYGHIRNWEKHQKVSHRGKRRIPPPSETPFESPETLANVSGDSPEGLVPDLRPMEYKTSDHGASTAPAELFPVCAGNAVNTDGIQAPSKPQRTKNSKPETDCPPTEASSSDVDAWCSRWGIPSPSADPEVTNFLNHHRAKGNRFRDWRAAWAKWESNARRWGTRGGTPRIPVQGGFDPNAHWLPKETA